VWTGLRSVNSALTDATVKIDDRLWFAGRASCVLIGNIGTILGGVKVFDDARPDDGWLDVGVCTAKGPVQWARAFGRIMTGSASRSRFVQTTRAQHISIDLDHAARYEIDGGVRKPAAGLEAYVAPAALTIRVPASNQAGHR
jgi:diacylglycerol kinase family enzyme